MNRIILAAAMCLVAASAWAEDTSNYPLFSTAPFIVSPKVASSICEKPGTCPKPDANWHLLTQSYGGTVSLLKGLTKPECDHVVVLLKDAIGAAIRAPQLVTPGDIKSAECFQ